MKVTKAPFGDRYCLLTIPNLDTNKMEMPECIKNGFFCTTVEHVEQMLMKKGV